VVTGGWANAFPALIGVIGVVVGALLTAVGQYWVQRAVRRKTTERAAVAALQDAALAVRDAARRAGEDPFNPHRQLILDNSLGRFDMLVERVVNPSVRERATAWRVVALRYFSGDEDVSRWQEEQVWGRLNGSAGEDLRENY
jgi:type II secretory pathway pseudopilin PulG